MRGVKNETKEGEKEKPTAAVKFDLDFPTFSESIIHPRRALPKLVCEPRDHRHIAVLL